MLLKLSMSSIKKRFKDYLVLLFGLTISIAIFYMFETLAQNEVFIKSNAMISSIVFVFHVGTFILGFITIFYIFYATSFLTSLRQKEMGMYLTLGAKKYKVTQMMFFETLFIGLVSLLSGIGFGVGLAKGIAELFMWQLDFPGEGFEPFYISSVITTVIFYLILFLLTAIVNAFKIARTSVLGLLRADHKQDQVKAKGSLTMIGVFFSIVLIGVGYYAMMHMGKLAHFGIILAAITITLGTYLFFISFLPYLVKKLKAIRSLNEKGINSFTLAQLRFRILNLTKVLGTVAMLVALGLGAMTAGLSFYHNIEKQSGMFYANDVAVHQPTEKDWKILKQLDLQEENVYHYKINDHAIYFLKDELLAQPPLIKQLDPMSVEKPKEIRVSEKLPKQEYMVYANDTSTEKLPEDWASALNLELNVNYQLFGNRDIYVVDKTIYKRTKGETSEVVLGRVTEFTEHLTEFEKLEEGQKDLASSYRNEPVETSGGKYSNYLAFKAISSGTIFMGMFLGIAFLMMMASVLMFKLLASASTDVKRYDMLMKIGVRKSLLSKSIYREIFLIFLFPALVGIVHVLVGMQMFSFIIVEPYTKIWLPISIFLIIYGLYYWLTVSMYKRIVLPKQAK